jgi:hypothetical protein
LTEFKEPKELTGPKELTEPKETKELTEPKELIKMQHFHIYLPPFLDENIVFDFSPRTHVEGVCYFASTLTIEILSATSPSLRETQSPSFRQTSYPSSHLSRESALPTVRKTTSLPLRAMPSPSLPSP